ncbi:TPA: hypothetical protein LVM04_001445 [Klebsiella michiganensis]|uniref:hypothetical protein n=1 Tax=Klebsiella michiganensis TaxID=1134687 RepID=UPI0028602A59|nr:hypothetical protein [Klebsiella michiganensis]HCC7079188.1 hypothetical protein [Klebsiella michiganensis]HDV9050284.1 hypothetical protein [Klebsiella michiganensis]HDV9062923.1 hypothetical protein [Klebsiella michiganensis]HDV9068150.1 hypothetical protein [Klebsiella michiganensis]
MRSITSGEMVPRCALLPGAALDAPCPGYGCATVCGPVARIDAQHRLRGNGATLRSAPGGGAGRLPGLRVRHRLRSGSPDRCAASPPGKWCHAALCSRGRRLTHLARATGIQPSAVARVRHKPRPGECAHRLRAGSPDRCAASPPGSRAHRGPALPGQPQLLQVAVQL